MQLSQRIERILDVLLDWILSFYNGEAPFNRIEPRRVRRNVQLDEAFFLENIVDFVTLVDGRIIKQNHGSLWEIQTPDELAKLIILFTPPFTSLICSHRVSEAHAMTEVLVCRAQVFLTRNCLPTGAHPFL